MKKPPEQTGESPKLQNKFLGSMIITKVLTGDTFKITSTSDKEDPNYTTAHVLKHKSYYLPKEPEKETTEAVLNNEFEQSDEESEQEHSEKTKIKG